MNDQQINEILDIIRSNYLPYYKNETKQDRSLVLKTWKYHFGNIPQDILFKCVMDYMATETNYPPTVAHINKLLYELINCKVATAEDSFYKIMDLVRRKGRDKYQIALEEFTPIEKQIVNNGYWRDLCMSESPLSVLKAQYIKTYNNAKEVITLEQRKTIPKLDSEKMKLLGVKNE